MPSVSVLLPVVNPDPTHFREALGSILHQTFSDFELLVIEAPGERSAAAVLTAVSDARVRHIALSGPPSLVDQLNHGLRIARGTLVVRMDADDVAEPERLARQVAFLDAHPEIAVAGTQLKLIDAHGRVLGFRTYPRTPEAVAAALPAYNPLAHPSVIARRDALLAVGGYHHWPGNEDYELWSRLARAGRKLANLPEPLLRYRIHGESMKASRARGILRGTLEVKRLHWAHALRGSALLRYWLEHALLLLPPRVLLRLFLWTHCRASLPSPATHLPRPEPPRAWRRLRSERSGATATDRGPRPLRCREPRPGALSARSAMPEGPAPSGHRVWIVVPAYNEAQRLGATLAELCRAWHDVVVVDDGSSDETDRVALTYPVWLLRHSANCGQGAALQTGIEFALGQGADFVVTFDADGQHSPADIARLLVPLRAGQADVVLGSRFLGQAPGLPWSRRVLLKCGVLFTRVFSRIRVTDTHNGLRAFTREAARRIRISHDRMAHASEILEQIRRHRLRYAEVPVTVRYSRETLAKGQRTWQAVGIVSELILGRLVR